MLLELLSCKPNLHTAVEVTGGNQLFHIVVDNDTVATHIVEILNKGKLGRATFMPLNRMSSPEVSYPDRGSEAVPLLKLLKFNALYAPAMKQVSALSSVMMSLCKRAIMCCHINRSVGHKTGKPCHLPQQASMRVSCTTGVSLLDRELQNL